VRLYTTNADKKVIT